MNARQKSEGEDRSVDGGEVVASADTSLCRENYNRDCHDLNYRAELSQERRAECAKAADHVDCCGAHQNEHIAANDGDGDPEGNGQMLWQRRGVNSAHG